MSDNLKQDLIDLCVSIFAHADLDYDITLYPGNSVNAYEAAGVAEYILHMLGMEYEDIEDDISTLVAFLNCFCECAHVNLSGFVLNVVYFKELDGEELDG